MWCSLLFLILLSGGASCRPDGQAKGASGAGQQGAARPKNNTRPQPHTNEPIQPSKNKTALKQTHLGTL